MNQPIDIQHLDGVCLITLNRPDKFNSFNREQALALQEALRSANEDPAVRCVLLTGGGKAFCAGQDLGEAIDPNGPGMRTILTEHYNPLVLQIRALSKPVVAAVNGVAAGAGASLALVCDVVVASDKASFVQAFTSIGLIPDSGGTLTLPRLIGFGRASATMLLGDRMTAQDALAAGMIYRVFPADSFAEDALNVARELAQRPTRALALVKEALNASTFADLEAQLHTELHLQLAAAETDDFKEGVAAFLEKRTPNFRGH